MQEQYFSTQRIFFSIMHDFSTKNIFLCKEYFSPLSIFLLFRSDWPEWWFHHVYRLTPIRSVDVSVVIWWWRSWERRWLMTSESPGSESILAGVPVGRPSLRLLLEWLGGRTHTRRGDSDVHVLGGLAPKNSLWRKMFFAKKNFYGEKYFAEKFFVEKNILFQWYQ